MRREAARSSSSQGFDPGIHAVTHLAGPPARDDSLGMGATRGGAQGGMGRRGVD